jgi:threonine dehydrogenase-like Zn-dependent dehydrogenase
MGVGVAGLQAIATARRLGAQVSATDVRSATKEQIQSLGAKPIFVEGVAGIEGEGKGGYASARTLGGKVTFVLGASGHIAGTINPASKNKRSYWLNDRMQPDAEKWFAQARELPGSWWTEWSKWLKPHGGKLVAARRKLGGGRRKPLEPAPGRYAKERL